MRAVVQARLGWAYFMELVLGIMGWQDLPAIS